VNQTIVLQQHHTTFLFHGISQRLTLPCQHTLQLIWSFSVAGFNFLPSFQISFELKNLRP
jgi:hypothetical protein